MTKRGDTRRSTALTRFQQPSIYDQRDYAAGCMTAFGLHEPYHSGMRTSTHPVLPGAEYLNEYGQPITTRRNEVTINPSKYANMDRDTAGVAREQTARYLGLTADELETRDPGDRATQILMAKVDNHKMKPREADDRDNHSQYCDASSSDSGSSGHRYIDLKPEETIIYHPRDEYEDYRPEIYSTGGSATRYGLTHAPSLNKFTKKATNVPRSHRDSFFRSPVPYQSSRNDRQSTRLPESSSHGIVQSRKGGNPVRKWVESQAHDPTYNSRPGQFDTEKNSSGVSHRVYKYW